MAYKTNSPLLQELMNMGVVRFSNDNTKLLLPDGSEWSGGGGGGVPVTNTPDQLYGTDISGNQITYGLDAFAQASGNSSVLYGNGPAGDQQEYALSVSPNSNEVPRRSPEGSLLSLTLADSDPAADGNDVINREYLQLNVLARAPATLTVNRDLSSDDVGRMLVSNAATNLAVTLPPGMPAGFDFRVAGTAAGRVSLLPGAGVSLFMEGGVAAVAPITNTSPYSIARVEAAGVNTYILTGWVEP